jgi:hypothetical protein
MVASPPITHQRYVSVAAPQFRNCHELSRSGEIRKFLAGEGATVSYTDTANVSSLIVVASGAILLVRRIEDRNNVRFEIDIPQAAPHFDGECTDDLPDAPPSAMPPRPTPARKGMS